MSLGGEDSINIGADFDGIYCVPPDIADSGMVYRLLDLFCHLTTKKVP